MRRSITITLTDTQMRGLQQAIGVMHDESQALASDKLPDHEYLRVADAGFRAWEKIKRAWYRD